MGVRKIVSFFFLLSLWNFSWGQGDSTQINFYIASTDSIVSNSDSILQYNTLILEFDWDLVENYQAIRVEVVVNDYDSFTHSSFDQTYSVSELQTSVFLSNNLVKIPLGESSGDLIYQVFLIVQDSKKHEVFTISKYVQL